MMAVLKTGTFLFECQLRKLYLYYSQASQSLNFKHTAFRILVLIIYLFIYLFLIISVLSGLLVYQAINKTFFQIFLMCFL